MAKSKSTSGRTGGMLDNSDTKRIRTFAKGAALANQIRDGLFRLIMKANRDPQLRGVRDMLTAVSVKVSDAVNDMVWPVQSDESEESDAG